MKAEQVAFAKKYNNWDIANWDKVLFPDDSTVHQWEQQVSRPVGTRYNDLYIKATVKHPPSHNLGGGAMSTKGTTELLFLPTGMTMNSGRYLEMLKDQL